MVKSKISRALRVLRTFSAFASTAVDGFLAPMGLLNVKDGAAALKSGLELGARLMGELVMNSRRSCARDDDACESRADGFLVTSLLDVVDLICDVVAGAAEKLKEGMLLPPSCSVTAVDSCGASTVCNRSRQMIHIHTHTHACHRVWTIKNNRLPTSSSTVSFPVCLRL